MFQYVIAEWWITFGESAPQLKTIAVRVLRQTTSSSNCERNWSMWSQVHTKARNRLQYKRLHMIVYLRYNMKLKIRHATRRSQQEIDSSFNPINLDYIFEDDPLNSWLEGREQPVFEGDDFEWMNFDEERDDNTIQIDDDPIIDLGASPPISYTNNQRSTSEGTSALGRPSDDDGDDGDDGGDDMLPFDQRRGATSNLHGMETYYGRDEPPMHQVPTQTFVRRRRGNEEQLDDIGESSA